MRLSNSVARLPDPDRDVREPARLARRRPGELAAPRSVWEAIDATLLPCPG